MWKVGLAVVSLGLVASGCGGYVDGSEGYSEDMSVDGIEDVDSVGEAAGLCANPEGVNYTMASLAVAAATDLKRWDHTDFAVVKKNNYSMYGLQEVLDLSNSGRNYCNANGGCPNVTFVLGLQNQIHNGKIKFPGGVTLQSDVLAQRLVANHKSQTTCNGQPGNLCPAEAHQLAFTEAKQGSCEMDFYYKVTKPGTELPIASAALLKNRMIMFGSLAGNGFLNFEAVSSSVVKVDPGVNMQLNGVGFSAAKGCYDLKTMGSFYRSNQAKAGDACCMGGETGYSKKKSVSTNALPDGWICQ